MKNKTELLIVINSDGFGCALGSHLRPTLNTSPDYKSVDDTFMHAQFKMGIYCSLEINQDVFIVKRKEGTFLAFFFFYCNLLNTSYRCLFLDSSTFFSGHFMSVQLSEHNTDILVL